MMDEFIDTYSDDLLYLIEARKVLLTHPFRSEYKKLCDASFCRLFAVFMIGSIEAMLEDWKEKDTLGILDKYFANDSSNGERIQSLYAAFKRAGINVDEDVFNDYLAIKYLRNIIVHARWKPHEKEWLQARGFPTDTRELTEEHWYKMMEINQNMMMYIALTGIPQLRMRTSDDKILRIKVEREELKPMIIKRKDLPFVIFKNLENIASELFNSIEKAATSEKYKWSKGLTSEDLEKLSFEDAQILFYRAAKRAADDGFSEILNCKQLAEEAIFFWSLYKQETFVKNTIQLKEIDDSLRMIMELHKRKSYPKGPFPWNRELPSEIKVSMVKGFLKDHGELADFEIAKSLDIGELAYHFMPNITLPNLFSIYLPIIVPERIETLITDAKFILAAWKLRDAWYSFIEWHNFPDISKWLFYEKIFDKLMTK